MPAIAKNRVVQTTRDGRAVVVSKSGSPSRSHFRDSRVSWGVGIGLGSPFYGGYGYSGYGYGGYGYGGYGYGGNPGYYGGYPYGYGNPYGAGYGTGYYTNGYPYYGRSVYRGYSGSVVARVQGRLARAGYYAGPIDGVIGPRTRYAIRVYESRHGLPADGRIDSRLLAVMGLA